ncbi:LysR family transcriptional regulator [Rhodococcus sp. BP-349]|uniref:LysR family transcriptional regulator n=1 Tax=unclassified Rhodococcus (in: high G+C Gram-positive bacteria) TaxID=192944 RepID=UPI001C9B3E24|nr:MULTISPECIES: LysR family transcriptional regulator [unclassified Rhodococcus (in: high G+C Gram-positive bacteria)]MBY6594258.1 LysR family transcriptional regulator [Rhodococcus sp. BP-359]MBY6602935.1 LysR family transcriptional regulator [Rhodococcus sp. BP-351]MBY6607271.1 LysR family transcriptional regulator [Rhodococcus sp. BP-361]MBY6611609.1 LysR family transcriptional regulator [Rhodococcus sp. BP-360]MBY6620284.1 LysR family transcriptional regulator [Rhodococcus sp. BP-357]MBY
MELRHLRYFVAIADAGSVNAAATAVRVAQPSLSRQLRQLENELGVELFDRSGNRLTLSPAGHRLLGDARSLLRRADVFVSTADFYAHGGLRRLSIAAPTVTLTDIVAPFVATLADSDPTVDVIASDGRELADMVTEGADIVIAADAAGDTYECLHLATLPVLAYAHPRHELAGRAEVTVDDVSREQLVLLPPGTAAREALRNAISSWDSDTGRAIEAANGTIAQALAAAGRGIAIVTDDPRFDLAPSLIRANSTVLSIQLNASWRSDHAGAHTLADIAHRLHSFVAERYRVVQNET